MRKIKYFVTQLFSNYPFINTSEESSLITVVIKKVSVAVRYDYSNKEITIE